jgi:hypothetical protein
MACWPNTTRALVLGGVLLATAPAPANAADERRADVAVELVATRYGEFDETGVGFGLRLSYRALEWLTVDGGLVFSPGDLGGRVAFSGSQLEGLFGLRAGPRLGAASVYGTLRAGFVSFASAPEPIACIAIFPPPLACVIAEGKTALATNFGAGGEIFLGPRALVRLEVGDLLIHYPGPALTRDEAVLEDGFWRHDFRAAVSVGIRF